MQILFTFFLSLWKSMNRLLMYRAEKTCGMLHHFNCSFAIQKNMIARNTCKNGYFSAYAFPVQQYCNKKSVRNVLVFFAHCLLNSSG